MLRTLFFLNANTKNVQEEEKLFLTGTGWSSSWKLLQKHKWKLKFALVAAS